MAGVRIGLVCYQLRAPTPAGRLVGVCCERRLGLPWLHGHALQSGTWQVRVPRRRYDFGDADQPELVCFAGDSDSLLLAESSVVWNLGFLMMFPLKSRLLKTLESLHKDHGAQNAQTDSSPPYYRRISSRFVRRP